MTGQNVGVRVRISGHVQGVFFRAYTRGCAQRLNIRGWVRNLPDGSVEAMLEGEKMEVDSLVELLRKGPQGASVSTIEIEKMEYKGDCSEFEIVY